ncbi:MAG: hypothetical protein ACRDA3_05335 [Peptostreptococcaceae bacterium]
MDIRLHELKKIIASPIIIFLTVLFIVSNIIDISNNSYIKDDIKAINKVIGDFGSEINDKTLKEMNSQYMINLEKINKISKAKINKTFNSIEDFMKSDEYISSTYDDDIFTEEEKQFFIEASALYFYLNTAKDTIQEYENINIREIGESTIKNYNLKGKAEKKVRKSYEELENRFEEIKANEEHKNLFFSGKIFKTHKLLYKDTIRTCVFEIVILIVLITTYLTNYEFDNKTSNLVYTTKRGRNNVKDKLLVGIFSSLIVSIIILGITLLAYFITFDYSNVLNVPINSAFNWDYRLPYISWFNITFIQHLGLSLLVILSCVPIFACITLIISKIVKNSYIVFFVFFILFGVFIMIPSLVSESSPLMFTVGYDIFNLILSPGSFFMQRGAFKLDKYYELTTILVWIAIVVIGSKLTIRKFKKIDIN